MPVDWKAKDSYTRLLAAMVAATPDMKLDYRKIASFYGQGATYDAIEGRFRVIKKEAATLKAEIDNGIRPEAPVRNNGNGNSPKKPRTPKKNDGSFEGVLSGRVTKSTNGSPSKKRSAAQIKREMHSSATSSMGEVVLPGLEDGDADGFADFDPTSISFEMLDAVSNHPMLGSNGVGIWDEQGV